MENSLLLKLILHRAEFLKADEKLKVLSQVKSVDELKTVSLRTLSEIVGRTLRSKIWNIELLKKEAEIDIKTLESGDLKVVNIESMEYPELLKNIYDPPYMLFYRGNLAALNEQLVSIVGTRTATGKAHRATFDLSFALGENGVGVVSGLAKGIDSTAHKGNLSGGGKTVAVLGTSVDEIYPKENKYLAIEILKTGGLLISEAPLRSGPMSFRFPQRNRIISGLSEITILSQAPKKSGALITCDFALEQNREVIVLKAGIDKIFGEGSQNLLDAGAASIEGIDDLKKILGIDINYILKEDKVNYLSGLEKYTKGDNWS